MKTENILKRLEDSALWGLIGGPICLTLTYLGALALIPAPVSLARRDSPPPPPAVSPAPDLDDDGLKIAAASVLPRVAP